MDEKQHPVSSKLVLLGAAQIAGAVPAATAIIQQIAPSVPQTTAEWIAGAVIGVLTIVFRALTHQPLGF